MWPPISGLSVGMCLMCRAPSDLAQHELKNAEAVPAYYHWMALLLQEKCGGVVGPQFALDGVEITVPPTAWVESRVGGQ